MDIPAIPHAGLTTDWHYILFSTPIQLLKLAVLSLIFIELLARAGNILLLFLEKPPKDSPAGYGTGLLAGTIVFGLVVTSLALTGLLYPSLVFMFMALLALAARLPLRPRLIFPGRMVRSHPVLAAAFFLVATIFILTPVMEIDAYLFHLASGWQFLQAHRVLLSGVSRGLLYPLPVEMAFVPAILTGDDRLTTCISLACFASVSLIFAGGTRRSRAGWLGPLLAVSAGSLPLLLATGKNDVIAASLFVSGALLLESGNPRIAAFLLGSCTSAKPVFIPFALSWWLFMRPRGTRLLGPGIIILATPILPWLAKSFLATGNPLYPFGAGWISTFGWGAPNMGRFMDYWYPLWMEGTEKISAFPLAFLRGISGSHPLVAAAIPGLLAFLPGRRRPLVVLLAAAAVTLGLGHTTRYLMPAIWLAALYTAEGLTRAGDRKARLLSVAAAAWSLLALALNPAVREFPGRFSGRHYGNHAPDRNGPFDEACRMVSRAGANRVLTVGEFRTYRIPARAIYDGMAGETPLIWKIVRESASTDEIARKLRQSGAGFILYNFVSAQYDVASTGKWFPWDGRMEEIWEDFCRTRLETASVPSFCDYSWGGYYLYRILSSPPYTPRSSIFYLPGADAISASVGEMRGLGDRLRATTALQRLVREIPAVLSFRCDLAGEYARVGRWKEALALLRPAVEAGMMHPSIPMYGMALAGTKRYPEARVALREFLPRYPADETMIRLTLAGVCIELARVDSRKGRCAGAEAMLDEAGNALAFQPTVRAQEAEKAAQGYRARILAEQAGILAARNRCVESALFYRKAAGMIPGTAEAEAWLDAADLPCGAE